MYNYKIGEIIKELRQGRNMTQKVLADRLGATTSLISQYENTNTYPSYDMLISIARIFNVTTDYLLGVEKSEAISVEGLTKEQVDTIMNVIEEYKKANSKK